MNYPGVIPTYSVVYHEDNKSSQSKFKHVDEKMVRDFVEQSFRTFDKNYTGQLDYVELSAFLENAIKQKILDEAGKYAFFEYRRKMDKNQDGLVSKE